MLFAFWQFGSAWMLGWAAAALLPILIHLWSRRKFREESWAAMEFLLAAMRKNARRIQLEQWLLLAVRTAILLVLALALADPQLLLLAGWTGGARGGQTHVLLVIDGSYSMDVRQDGKSRFDAARELARQTIESGRQGDGYTLLVMGQPPQVVIGQPAFDSEDVREELDNLRMPHGGASLPATLAEVETILRQAAENHPRLARRQVVYFSDLQARTWNDVTTADCRDRLARLASLASLSLVDLGDTAASNLAVARLEAGQPVVTSRGEVSLSAEITSFSRQDAPRQAVAFVVDGRRIADERVDVPAGGSVTVAASHRFDTRGEHVVEVQLTDDALPLDNRRWLSLPVRESVRVLVVASRPGEGRYIRLALNPQPQAGGAIDVTEVAEGALLETELAAFDCVVLSNVGRFSREEASLLHRFVHSGGGLIFFLGDQVQAANYNQLLADDEGSRVLPARLGDLAVPGQYRFNPLDYQHPIVAPFRGHEASGLLTTPIWRYIHLSPLPESKVALALDTGEAALVAERIGRGRSLLFSTAASPDSLDRSTDPPTPWTAMASWPSFPPLVHETLQFAIGGRLEGRNTLVGDDLSGLVRGAPPDAQVRLTLPDASVERLPVVADGADGRWTYQGLLASGVYEAQLPGSTGSGERTSQKFAVNVDAREGDLTRFDPELLPSQFNQTTDDSGQPAVPSQDPARTSYFRLLLGLLLALVIAEPCLAWHFGRGRA